MAKANVSVKVFGSTNVAFALEKRFKLAIDKNLLEQIAKFIVERIQAFTRSGKSLASGRPKDLKKLSDSYLNVRRGAMHFRTARDGHVFPIAGPDPRLQDVDQEFFFPELSQLTFTGQMLASLQSSIDARRLTIEISPTGSRTDTAKLTNKDVAEYVVANGRPFLGLDDAGRKNIVNQIKAAIRRKFK